MSPRQFKLHVLACAPAWLLVGIYSTTTLQALELGRTPDRLDLAMLVGWSIVGISDLWRLLHAPLPLAAQRGADPPGNRADS